MKFSFSLQAVLVLSGILNACVLVFCVVSVVWFVWVLGYFLWLQFVQCFWLYFFKPCFFYFCIAVLLLLHVDVDAIWSQAHILTLILLMWRKVWASNDARKWQMGFNSVFKGLIQWMFLWYQWLREARSKEVIRLDVLFHEEGSRGAFRNVVFLKTF
jgi:hypothetical protein